MFDFEREYGIEENNHAVLPPSPTSPCWEEEENEEEEFLFTSWVKTHWQIGMRVTAALPFFLLFVISFLAVTFWPAAVYLFIWWFASFIGVQLLK